MISKIKFNKTDFYTYIVWIMLITLVITLLNGCSGDSKIVLTTGFKEGEVFRIDNMSCYQQEAYVYLANIRNQYANVYGNEIWTTSQNGIYLSDNVKSTVLGRLSKIKMMTLMAEEYGVVLEDEELEAVEKAAREYYQSLRPDEIASMGDVTLEDIIQMYQDYALANKVYHYVTQDVNTEVSDDEARTIILKMVFVDSANGQDAESIANEAKNSLDLGTNIDDVILEYSDMDPENFYFKKDDIDPQIRDTAFALAEGEISDVLLGEKGYYILYCISPNDTSRTEVSKAEIIEKRKQETFENAYQQFIVDRSCYLNEELWNSLDYISVEGQGTTDFFDIYDKYF